MNKLLLFAGIATLATAGIVVKITNQPVDTAPFVVHHAPQTIISIPPAPASVPAKPQVSGKAAFIIADVNASSTLEEVTDDVNRAHIRLNNVESRVDNLDQRVTNLEAPPIVAVAKPTTTPEIAVLEPEPSTFWSDNSLPRHYDYWSHCPDKGLIGKEPLPVLRENNLIPAYHDWPGCANGPYFTTSTPETLAK